MADPWETIGNAQVFLTYGTCGGRHKWAYDVTRWQRKQE